jgi:hypothetical protein
LEGSLTAESEALTTQAQEQMAEADAALDTHIDQAVDEFQGEPSEADDSTEAPKAEEAEPSPEDTPPTKDEAQPRNEDGTFAKKPEPEAQPEGAPEGEATEEQPAGEGEAEAEPAEVELEPFTFKADGTEFEVPGSAVSEDGLYIPPDQLETVTQLMRFGKTYQGSFREQLAAGKEEVKSAQVERDAAQAARTSLLEKLAAFEGQPEAFEAFMADFNRELPMLLANAKTAEAEALREADRAKVTELEREADFRAKTPVLEDRLEEAIKYYGEAHGIDVEGMRTLWTRLRAKDQFDRIFTRSDQGEWDEDLSIIEEEARYLAAAIGNRALKEVEPQRKEAKANQKALDALKGKGKKPPPTAPAKKGPAPKPVAKSPEFKTTAEADEWFEGGGYHEAFE